MVEGTHFVTGNILRDRLRDYEPGQRFPSESTLTRGFKVSRVTLRRTVAGLVEEGLVEQRQGKGTFYVGGTGTA